MATNPDPELSSLSTALDELTDRVGAIAQDVDLTEEHDDVRIELIEIERILNTARRRLDKLTSRSGR